MHRHEGAANDELSVSVWNERVNIFIVWDPDIVIPARASSFVTCSGSGGHGSMDVVGKSHVSGSLLWLAVPSPHL